MKILPISILLILHSCKVSNIDTPTVEIVTPDSIPQIREYKELVISYGDTAVTYDGDLIILSGRTYVSEGTTAWLNRKVVVVIK